MKKILVALSGGTDSSAVAAYLLDRGYDVHGGTMVLTDGFDTSPAQTVCDALGIPLHVFDMRAEFAQLVMTPFCREYTDNKTPNPCIVCNKELKFGLFSDKALSLGFDGIATGHYARVVSDGEKYYLKKARCAKKDQSYVLYNLTQHILSHILLPLGEFESKDAVRQYCEDKKLPTAQSKDSQDICFIPDGDYASFIVSHTGYTPAPGDFTDKDGNVLGTHKGLIHYTLGQRRFLNISLGKRAYVVKKDAAKNTVTLGDECELYIPAIRCKNVNFINTPTSFPLRVSAVTRYGKTPAAATLYECDGGIECVFDTPQKFAAAGQSAVFYDGDTVIGGGIIQ